MKNIKSQYNTISYYSGDGEGFFVLYKDSEMEDYIEEGYDLILNNFLPLTDASTNLLAMVHPHVPQNTLRRAMQSWHDDAKKDLPYYTFFDDEGEWR